MFDAGRVERGGGEPVFNPETGKVEPPPPVLVYEGRCKVQTWEAFESNPQAGERKLTVQRYYLHVPVGCGPFAVGDTITITAAVENPNLPGTQFTVSGLNDKTLQTAQRLLIDEVVA
jgi:hypothetical protein